MKDKDTAEFQDMLAALRMLGADLVFQTPVIGQVARKSGSTLAANPDAERLLSSLGANAGLVTLCDAAPASLSWLGGVLGQRVAPLGVDRFGQTGSLADLYAAYRLDGNAITEAIAEVLLRNG